MTNAKTIQLAGGKHNRIEELTRAGEEMAGCLRRNAISDESTDAPFNEDADLALQRWDRLRSTEEREAEGG